MSRKQHPLFVFFCAPPFFLLFLFPIWAGADWPVRLKSAKIPPGLTGGVCLHGVNEKTPLRHENRRVRSEKNGEEEGKQNCVFSTRDFLRAYCVLE